MRGHCPLLWFLVTLVENVISTGSCVNLDPLTAMSTVCYGAVNYKFYLAQNFTLAYYNNMALNYLNNSRLVMLPIACQIGIKNLVCSNIYLKCPDGIQLNSPFTGWNLAIYNALPLPFQRPCASVCTSIQSKCLGLTSLLGINFNCSAQYDYSHGYFSSSVPQPLQYDPLNNNATCNAMTANFQISSTREPYLKSNDPKGACYGFTTELFIPPSSSVSATLAPLQPPYVIQTAIESTLAANFAKLPVFMSSSCSIALRRYFCSSYMIRPQTEVLGDILKANGLTAQQIAYLSYKGFNMAAILAYSINLPSYPHRSICLDYQNKCSGFIAAANLPIFIPYCNAMNGPVAKYPTDNQTIQNLPIEALHLTIPLVTSPNVATVSPLVSYSTKCPQGYVVPNRVDRRTTWVPGTGCAVSCKAPYWSYTEWSQLERLAQVLGWIGLVLISVLLLSNLLDSHRRKHQMLVTSLGFFSMLATLYITIMSFIPFEDRFCASNAVLLDHTDGNNFCTSQVYVLVASGLGTVASWMAVAVDLFLQVVVGIPDTDHLKIYFLGLIGLIPTVFLIVVRFQRFGFVGTLPMCFVYTNDDLASFYIPVTVMTMIGILAIVAVLFKLAVGIFRSRYNKDSRPVLSAAIAPTLFVLSFLVLIVSLLIFRIVVSQTSATSNSSLRDFTACVFGNYVGDDSKWQSVCGTHPSVRALLSISAWVYFCIAGQSILIAVVYLSGHIWEFWRDRSGLENKNAARGAVVQTASALPQFDPEVTDLPMADIATVSDKLSQQSPVKCSSI